MFPLLFAATFAVLIQSGAPSSCVQGVAASPEQRERRLQGLGLARIVNSEQTTEKASSGRLLTKDELARRLPQAGGGWEFDLLVDGDRYMLAVQDATDPCRHSFFSDQRGVIYAAEPIR